MITAVQLLEGDGISETTRKLVEETEAELRAEIRERELDVYPLAVGTPDLWTGAATLVQSWGVGPIRSNTVLLNWMGAASGGKSAALWYGRLLGSAIRLDQNVVVLDTDETSWICLDGTPNEERRIDVWWFDDESSRMMLLFAYLMTRTEEWDEATIRVLVPTSKDTRERVERKVRHRLEEGRIEASIEAVIDADKSVLVAHSNDASMVFLPLRIQGMRLGAPLTDDLPGLLMHLPVVALVAAAQDVELTEEEAEPPPATEDVDSEPADGQANQERKST